MTCVVLQPSYIPWRGYFHQIRRADTFVFYDDAQYDARGWRNRNRVKAPGGTRWLTIPVLSRGAQVEGTLTNEIEICWDRDWARTHHESLRHLYGRAPHFDRYASLLERFYGSRPQRLADYTIQWTQVIAAELGIENTHFLRSSRIERPPATKTDDLLAILQHVGADHYLTGPAARDYLDEELMQRNGVEVEYMTYDYPEYPQLYPPFEPQVSILDLLFMTGPEAPTYIWGIRQKGDIPN